MVRKAKRNGSRMQGMTWGTMPEFKAFRAHVESALDEDDNPVVGPPGDVYHMELVGNDKESSKLALKVLFASGTPVKYDQFDGRHGKYGLRFHDLMSLHKFLVALLTVDEMQAEESGDEERSETPGDLASSIMGALNYEWI